MTRRSFVIVAFVATLALFFGACSGGGSASSPTSPSTPSVPAGPVMAPPPPGVSPEVWRVAFNRTDARLYRPQAGEVHLDVSALSQPAQSTVAKMAAIATVAVNGNTTFDTVPISTGATFVVSVTPDLICNKEPSLGCTKLEGDSIGNITGGKIEFLSMPIIALNENLVLHEILRTLGMNANSPVAGIMALIPWPQAWPSDEEQKMLMGRYKYPLLSVYQAQ